MAKKYYAVKHGRETGIFETWQECQKQVKGFSGACYKGFLTREEAQNYLNNKKEQIHNKNGTCVIDAEKCVTAYVDGSYSEKVDRYSYGCVIITPAGEEIHLSGSNSEPETKELRNVAGEMIGAMTATRWAVMHDFLYLDLYYDYEGIEKWVTYAWKANKKQTKKYAEYMNSLSQKIQINFHKVPAHSGVKYNEMADKLAKKALTCHNNDTSQKDDAF